MDERGGHMPLRPTCRRQIMSHGSHATQTDPKPTKNTAIPAKIACTGVERDAFERADMRVCVLACSLFSVYLLLVIFLFVFLLPPTK